MNNDELSIFIDELGDFGKYDSKSPYFYGWKSIKVYYDNGQVELSKILSLTFNIMLGEITFKKVMPKDYKLFQVADLFCTIENLRLKIEHKTLTKSEHIMLGTEKEIKKNVISKLDDKYFKSL